MKADLDFDLVAHLGFVRNVDLLNKGIYVVQIRLYYEVEGKLVAPVGMFSSPSSVGSVVQSQSLPPAPICSVCEVDDSNRSFRTRSLIVRYKDEKYELNDGVHWRLTLPACNLPENSDEQSDLAVVPRCSQLLHMKFDLLFAPFKVEDPAGPKVDLIREVHKLIPDDPIFSIVATQNIIIENASSGIHSYYPVHFNGSYIMELDCMIHCAITGIRYPDLVPKPIVPLTVDAQAQETTLAVAEGAAQQDMSKCETPAQNRRGTGTGNGIAASTTPMKVKAVEVDLPSRPLPATPHTPPPINTSGGAAGDGTNTADENSFATPNRNTGINKRYVPVLSPHSTVMPETPTQQQQPEENSSSNTPSSAMNRLSRNLGNWRRSVTTSLASPVPLMDKISTIGANSTRRLSALTSVLTSPIGEAAAKFRAGDATPAATATGQPVGNDAEQQQGELSGSEDGSGNNVRAGAGAGNKSNLVGDLLAESDTAAAAVASGEKEDTLEQALEKRAGQQMDASELLAHRCDPLLNPERWLQRYATPVVSNYSAACHGMAQVLNLYYHVQDSEETSGGAAGGIGSGSPRGTVPTTAVVQQQQGVKERAALHQVCELETARTEILAEIIACTDEAERIAILKEKVDLCNLQLTLHWSLLMTALRRVMGKLCPVMKAQYVADSKRFWRGQVLVQTKSITQTANYRPAEIQMLLDIVDSQIQREEISINSSRRVKDSKAGCTSTFRRNMQIFDKDLHMRISKLPHMVVQQYVGNLTSAKPSIAELNSRLRASINPDVAAAAAAAEQSPSALSQAIKAVGGLKNPEGGYPPGTVYLARGGQILDELTVVDRNLGVMDGEAVDLLAYPQLLPLGHSKNGSSGGVVVGAVSKENEGTPLDTKDIQVNCAEGEEVTSSATKNASSAVQTEQVKTAATRAAQATSTAPDAAEPANAADAPPPFPIVRSPKHHAGNGNSSTSSSGTSSAQGRHNNSLLNWSDAFKAPGEVAETNTVHLVVLQHGFLGLSYDMQMIENALRLELPGKVEMFLATSNEGREQDSIAQMGKRLAFELLQHCKEYHPSLLKVGSKSKLSFIGHSMGGLIIRAALQEGTMKPMLSKLHTYVSLASPHVGSLFPSSQIVSTGMWALFKWKKYKALKELVLEDSIMGKTKKTFLYKLSENGVLTYFRKIVLVSSPKDQYVPSYSARIQTCQKSETDATLGVSVSEMVQNLLEPLRADQLVRITMDNNVGETVDVNALIGRTAHICYLENPVAATMLVQAVKPYFLVDI